MLPVVKEAVDAASAKMKAAAGHLEEELRNFRVGKASPTLLNPVVVDYYGTPTPIAQVASVTTPDAKTLSIQPWDKGMIGKIEKAIQDANLGLTPSNNGETIRCMVPALTEETRKELVKKARAAGETAKVSVRGARRDGIDQLKKACKGGEISEDGQKEGEDELQKATDKWSAQIDQQVAAKEKDMLTV